MHTPNLRHTLRLPLAGLLLIFATSATHAGP